MKQELKKFTDAMNEEYTKQNLIDKYCKIEDFNKNEKEFIQIGERINLPKEFFIKEQGVHKDNSVLASDFIRSLVNGENNFVLKEIVGSDNVQKNKINRLSHFELSRIISKLKNATDIFFPIEPFFKKIHYMSLDMPDRIKFVHGRGPVLIVCGKEVNIHWITSHQEINKIIVSNKEELKIIRKKFGEANSVNGVKPIKDYESLNQNNGLMLYFAEKDKDNFDFVFRSVLSKPHLNENSAIVVDFQDV
jgi:uncharacterized protein (UPF0216 family)